MEKTGTTNDDVERFRSGAAKYAAYLETFEGRLRIDLAIANLKDMLPQTAKTLNALDVGGGTGTIAVRLARLGLDVTVLDESLPMLEIAERTANEAGLSERIELKHGSAAQLEELFSARSFDVILCHNILEFVDDPCAVLQSAARLLRDTSSIISVLVRNQAGEVLKSALVNADLSAAEDNLDSMWGDESLYGSRVHLFTPQSMHAMFLESSLEMVAEHGVRVVSDYLAPTISRSEEYDRIFELERKMGRRPDFASVARYTQCIAHRPATKDVS
jgi:S-adenosylmethionine-dependent methyltransferase